MAYDQIHIVDATSQMIEIGLRSSTTGQLLPGKAYGDVVVKYHREGAAAATTVSVVTATKGSFTSGGFVETDIAGIYQFGIPNAALATGAKAVTLTFACTGALDVVKRIVLIGADLRNATTLGLTNLDAISDLALASQVSDIAALIGTPVNDLSTDINDMRGTDNDTLQSLSQQLDNITVSNIADGILKRDWTEVTGAANRSMLNALRFLRNKWSISGSTLTVTEEDDLTPAWTATLSTDAAADPVSGSDPA